MLKVDIRGWSLEKFGEVDKAIEEARSWFDAMDRFQEDRNLSELECVERSKCKVVAIEKSEG